MSQVGYIRCRLHNSDFKNAVPAKPSGNGYWMPMVDLEVQQGAFGPIQCLGMTASNNRCRWNSNHWMMSNRMPQIKAFITKLSQKSPHNVIDKDLWSLLDLATCDTHGYREDKAKAGGFRLLQNRLAATQSRVREQQVSHLGHHVIEANDNLIPEGVEVQKLNITIQPLEGSLDSLKQTSNLQTNSSPLRLQDEQTNCFTLGAGIMPTKAERLESVDQKLVDIGNVRSSIYMDMETRLKVAHQKFVNWKGPSKKRKRLSDKQDMPVQNKKRD